MADPINVPPERYCGVPVPATIAALWHRPAAAAWRRARFHATNRLYPPTEHTRMRPPDGMCPKHLASWRSWRDHRFDPRTGDRWPGTAATPFDAFGHTRPEILLEQHRTEWDTKTLEQMVAIEALCAAACNCSDLPDTLTWSTSGPLAWTAEAEDFHYATTTIDRAVYLTISAPDAAGDPTALHESRHPHVTIARRTALDHWRHERARLLASRTTDRKAAA